MTSMYQENFHSKSVFDQGSLPLLFIAVTNADTLHNSSLRNLVFSNRQQWKMTSVGGGKCNHGNMV